MLLHLLSRFNVERLDAYGRGVVQDYVLAHMWNNIAAAKGNDSAKEKRDGVAKLMSPSQIAEAQKLARDCEKKYYKNCD